MAIVVYYDYSTKTNQKASGELFSMVGRKQLTFTAAHIWGHSLLPCLEISGVTYGCRTKRQKKIILSKLENLTSHAPSFFGGGSDDLHGGREY